MVAKRLLAACKAGVKPVVFFCSSDMALHLCIIKRTNNKQTVSNKQLQTKQTMKKFLFTIIAIVSFGIVAEAQTNSATIRKASELSLDNAIEISFNGEGAVLSTQAAETYVKSIKAHTEKTFNTENTNETYYTGTQTTKTVVPATDNNTENVLS
jgi:hypothetical protein